MDVLQKMELFKRLEAVGKARGRGAGSGRSRGGAKAVTTSAEGRTAHAAGSGEAGGEVCVACVMSVICAWKFCACSFGADLLRNTRHVLLGRTLVLAWLCVCARTRACVRACACACVCTCARLARQSSCASSDGEDGQEEQQSREVGRSCGHIDAAVVGEEKLSREDRKLRQQMELFEKMEALRRSKGERSGERARGAGERSGERAGGAVTKCIDEPLASGIRPGLSEKEAQRRHGAAGEERKRAGADDGDKATGPQERVGKGSKRWEDAVPRHEVKSELSREERKMRQQMELMIKMETLKREREENARKREEAGARRGDEHDSSSEEESSEDELVTKDTPRARHELEVLILVKHGKQVLVK